MTLNVGFDEKGEVGIEERERFFERSLLSVSAPSSSFSSSSSFSVVFESNLNGELGGKEKVGIEMDGEVPKEKVEAESIGAVVPNENAGLEVLVEKVPKERRPASVPLFSGNVLVEDPKEKMGAESVGGEVTLVSSSFSISSSSATLEGKNKIK